MNMKKACFKGTLQHLNLILAQIWTMLRCFGVLESSLPQEFLVESRSPCFVKFSHSSRSSQAATAHHTLTTAAIILNEIVCFTPDIMA